MTIAPTAGLMRLPSLLTGKSGAAIETLGELRGVGAMSHDILDGVANGPASASQATNAFSTLGRHADHASLRDAINGIRPELRHVFGSTGQQRLSGELQASASQIGSAREILALPRPDALGVTDAATSGRAAAAKLVRTIDDALPQLRSEARATAARRVTAGIVGVGAVGTGIAGLTRSSGDGAITAPGPPGEKPHAPARTA